MVRHIGLHSGVMLSVETPNRHTRLLFLAATRHQLHNPQHRLPETTSRDAAHRNQNNNVNTNRRLCSRGAKFLCVDLRNTRNRDGCINQECEHHKGIRTNKEIREKYKHL
ncbi:hypothetical protein L798_14519 [Zootermopsis nevadensis]|uniref:Uncharacterized protein n=1 Tax=Zootermopsis nevadensis TaxID=136037 RepID=A0A067QNX5_ZOONE|nr:hypothetical protein L798_14519 [Zootermopsis nevadensis]